MKNSNEIAETENPIATPEPKEKEQERSASYPNLTVEEAFQFSQKIYAKLGRNAAKREEIAQALDKHHQTIARDMASCVAYGFLTKTAEGYAVSELFMKLLTPDGEKERRLNYLIAFGKPKLYAALIEKFDGYQLPEEFHNHLFRNHGITQAASNLAADVFLKSGKFAGAINDNLVLKYKVTLSTTEKTQYAVIEEVPPGDGQPKNPPLMDNNIGNKFPMIQINNPQDNSPERIRDKQVPIYLTKDKTAYFVYPGNVTEKDVKIIQHQIEGILLRIQLEAEDNASDGHVINEKSPESSPQS